MHIILKLFVIHNYNLLVSTKRGIKIRNVQVESIQSREFLQQDLFLLSQQTVPNEFQSQTSINILWRELPMSPRLSNCEKYSDIIFNVRSHLFCCHKVKIFLLPFIICHKSYVAQKITKIFRYYNFLFLDRQSFGPGVIILERWLMITLMKVNGMHKLPELPYQSTIWSQIYLQLLCLMFTAIDNRYYRNKIVLYFSIFVGLSQLI